MSKTIRDYLFKPFLVSALFLSLISPVNSRGDERFRYVFNRVAKEIGINSEKYPIPEINFVSKGELKVLIKKAAKKAYAILVQRYGEEKGKIIFEDTIRKAGSFYDSKREEIYISKALPYCEQMGKLAHGLSSYLSDKEFGKLGSLGNELEIMKKYHRQRESSIVEKIISEECSTRPKI